MTVTFYKVNEDLKLGRWHCDVAHKVTPVKPASHINAGSCPSWLRSSSLPMGWEKQNEGRNVFTPFTHRGDPAEIPGFGLQWVLPILATLEIHQQIVNLFPWEQLAGLQGFGGVEWKIEQRAQRDGVVVKVLALHALGSHMSAGSNPNTPVSHPAPYLWPGKALTGETQESSWLLASDCHSCSHCIAWGVNHWMEDFSLCLSSYLCIHCSNKNK